MILTACAFMLVSLCLTVSGFTLVLRFTALERFGMSAHLSPAAALTMAACCAPLALLGASLMTIVAAFTRSYREAQTWLGFVLLVPTLPLIYAGITAVRPSLPLMAVPSLSQHFLIMSVLRDEPLPASYVALSVAGKSPGLDLEAILDVTAPARLPEIPRDRELARCPLPQDMVVLVQHQFRFAEELLRAARQIDPTATRRRTDPAVESGIQRVLDDAHVIHGLTEERGERLALRGDDLVAARRERAIGITVHARGPG
jgi:hypothetical protein